MESSKPSAITVDDIFRRVRGEDSTTVPPDSPEPRLPSVEPSRFMAAPPPPRSEVMPRHPSYYEAPSRDAPSRDTPVRRYRQSEHSRSDSGSESGNSKKSRRTELDDDHDSQKLEKFLMVQTLEKQLEQFGVRLPKPVHPRMSLQELSSIYSVLKKQRLKIKGGKQLRSYLVSGANLIELSSTYLDFGLELEDFSVNIEDALDQDETLVDDLAEEESALLNIPSSVRLALLLVSAGISTHAMNIAKRKALSSKSSMRHPTGHVSMPLPSRGQVLQPMTEPPAATILQSAADISIDGSDISGSETSSRRGKRRGRKPALANEGATITL